MFSEIFAFKEIYYFRGNIYNHGNNHSSIHTLLHAIGLRIKAPFNSSYANFCLWKPFILSVHCTSVSIPIVISFL